MADRQRTPRDTSPTNPFDPAKFINPAQVGGIESYTLDNGPGRGVRALCFNTGGGLRYRVLVDRGMDIDQAFVHQYSLAFLTHKGVSPPLHGRDRHLDWLRNFPGGLLTSCGPFNIGPPGQDAGEDLPLHGVHSGTAAEIESVLQPDPAAGQLEMSATGVLRYSSLFGPCVRLRRTLASRLGENFIDITDEFFNAGNQSAPHAWLLHINFGYPLVDAGSEFCYDSPEVEPTDTDESRVRFKPAVNYKRVPDPADAHRGARESAAYLRPRPTDRQGNTTVGLVNRRLSIGVAVRYNTRQFPRCLNWQHWGPGEYVTALEPANGTVAGRSIDRERGLLDELDVGERRVYRYRIEAVTARAEIEALRRLNDAAARADAKVGQ